MSHIEGCLKTRHNCRNRICQIWEIYVTEFPNLRPPNKPRGIISTFDVTFWLNFENAQNCLLVSSISTRVDQNCIITLETDIDNYFGKNVILSSFGRRLYESIEVSY